MKNSKIREIYRKEEKWQNMIRIITWCLTFCDSNIDERIIFDYIFGDMMSVSDTQYLNDRALYENMTHLR